MNKLIKSCCTIALFGFASTSGMVWADQASVKKALEASMPGFKMDSIEASSINGLYEVMAGSSVFYVSEDGRYLIEGHLIDVKERKDITEPKIAKGRVAALDKIGESKMIVFSPEKPQHTVSVFTDIDCGYCRKLHSEIDKYMAEGIKIRYLFFPRAGEGSESYDKAVSVWCADDKAKALTEAKVNNKITEKTCDNPVKEQMALGASFGMRGTPLIVTEAGTMIPGYVDAKRLKDILEKE